MGVITVKQYRQLAKRIEKNYSQYSRVKSGWITLWNGECEYKFYARSKYEEVAAKMLSAWVRVRPGFKWCHEDITLHFEGYRRGCVCYVPDFTLYCRGEIFAIYEVKGRFQGKDATKIKRFQKAHPELFEKFVYITDYVNFPKLIKLGVKTILDIKKIRGLYGKSVSGNG